MRRSDLAIVFIVASALIPATALAQQSATDTNQSSSQVGPNGNPLQAGPSQTQSTPTQPERTPQQSDEHRERDRRSAEDTRINRLDQLGIGRLCQVATPHQRQIGHG